MGAFDIYKRGQGRYVRIGTFAGVTAVGLIGAVVLSEQFAGFSAYVKYGVPVMLTLVLAGLMFWVVNRPRWADFMIATESEMKKVSWSSRKEVVGSTKVVIVTTFLLAIVLFTVDFLFVLIFSRLGILA